ncbi:MAG: hypothetical protein JWQ96_309, partial [Segetibacter sp.]|nr:hypothetical protein [Segetibacter sp.]
MKNFVLLFLLVAYTATPGFTQTKNTGSVRGKVTDSTGNQSLKDATVSVLDAGDSSVVVFGLSKEDGTFFIENVPFGNNILLVTYQGFGELEKLFTLSAEKPEFNAGSIRLASLPADLGNVTVKTSPIVVKGDTTEFNASSFKTKPNSTAEDLLKKLPGVEVEKDGSIKAQGQTVTRVMVDGKRFFGDDPTLATRNIPTDMIDKIQVVDGQSDQSAFSGFDDGNRQMTINITTKKDRRKGLFGKAALGVGNDDLAFKNETRYAANTNISYFNGDRRISVVAQANNNNGQNFSSQDILGTGGGRGGGNFGGGGGNFGGGFNTGPTGFTTTRMGGLNYSDIWSPKTNMSASYFYNNQNRINRQDRLRETLVTGDSSRFTTTNSFSDNKNSNNRFNFEIEHRFDTMNSITIRPTFNQQQTDNISNSTSFTTKGKLSPVNDVTRTTRTETKGYNFNNTILYRHRFAKRGRSMSLNLTQGLNTNEGNTKTLSYNNSYTNGSIRRDTTNQISINDRESKSYGASLSYVEPISTKGKLELNYRYNYSQSNSDRNAMMFNVNTNKYDINNIQLSNTFEIINTVNQASLNYQRQINQLFNYTVGLGVQHSEVSNDNKTKKTYLKQAFNNFTPTFSLVYRKDRSMNIRFNYTGSTQQPDVTL